MVVDIETKSSIKKFNNESDFIKNIRTRKTDKNVMRIVFDIKSNFYIDKHFYLKKNEKKIFSLVIDLKEKNKKEISKEKKKEKNLNLLLQ